MITPVSKNCRSWQVVALTNFGIDIGFRDVFDLNYKISEMIKKAIPQEYTAENIKIINYIYGNIK